MCRAVRPPQHNLSTLPTHPINPKQRAAFSTRSILLVALVLGAAAALAAFSFKRSPASQPIPSTPRIVSLSPAIAITLRDLGLSHLIVGRDAYDRILPASVPVCGDLTGIDYEHLLAVHPTHIFLQLGAKQIPGRLTELAARDHWIVRDFPQLSLDDITSVTRDLQQLLAPGTSSPLFDEMKRAWSRRAEGFGSAGRILLLAAIDPPSALGPGSCHQQILERIGAAPAITDGAPYITLDAEDLLKLKPDGIILILPRDPGTPAATATPDDLLRLLGRVGQLDLPAVRNSRLALIDDPLAHTPSTAMIGVADQIAAILERWNTPPR
jgi:ABC-type Fe3+-hydroxamate transport system substrate-binding protein